MPKTSKKAEQKTSQSVEKLIDIKAVEEMLKFKRGWIYRKIKEGAFPEPVKIGRATRWKLSTIQNWINEQK